MTPEEVTEGNKLIADFMNLEIINVVWGNGEKQGQSFNAWRHPEVSSWIEFGKEHWLKYHILWDWLMPIVEKIELSGFKTEIRTYDLSEGWHSMKIRRKLENVSEGRSGKSKIEAVWLAVVEFIKFWNEKAKY